jgi:hypothetical protein
MGASRETESFILCSPWWNLPELFSDWNSVFRRFSRKGMWWRNLPGDVRRSRIRVFQREIVGLSLRLVQPERGCKSAGPSDEEPPIDGFLIGRMFKATDPRRNQSV